MSPEALAADLRRTGEEAGLDALGFTDAAPFTETRRHLEERKAAGLAADMQFTYRNPTRSTDPQALLPGARSIVVGARRYLRAAVGPHAGPAGAVARYSWIDHYEPLRASLDAVAASLQAAGWRTAVVADANALVDRAAAHRAGLGWFGHNTLLLLPGKGSWFVLGSVVTDAVLPVTPEPVADGCGSCHRCQAACPTGALDQAGVLDARRCLAWLVQARGVFPFEHRVALGARLYGCDECQEVCPVNRLGARREPSPAVEAHAEPFVEILDLLAATDAELLARHGRWYIPDRQPRYLRRNALIVLGNVGDPNDPRVRQAVEAALSDEDSLLRAHAVWAAARLGWGARAEQLSQDPAPEVRAEVAAVPVVPARLP